MRLKIVQLCCAAALIAATINAAPARAAEGEIVHDAEYYILEAQNGAKWAVEDAELDKKLAALREKYGTPPNIVYILWDDAAFGTAGFPELQKNFGYETPNINRMAAEVEDHAVLVIQGRMGDRHPHRTLVLRQLCLIQFAYLGNDLAIRLG